MAKMIGAIPWLACNDVEAEIEWFVTKLGFSKEWTWGDPPTDGGVCRDDVRLYLFQNADLAARIRDSEISFPVEDIDALYAEHQQLGAPIERELMDEPWGVREYHVREPHGYKLRFGGEIK